MAIRTIPKKPTSFIPSVAMARWANPIIRVLLLSPLHAALSNDLMVITFLGRKSHSMITIPVSYFREGDTITLFTRDKWWKNLRDYPHVTMRVHGRNLQGMAEIVTGTNDVVEGIADYILMKGLKNVWKIRLSLDRRHEPSRDDLIAAAQELVMVRIGISGAGSQGLGVGD